MARSSRQSREEPELHIVEQIHKRSVRNGKEQFLVEWEGLPLPKDFTWEPRENLVNCDLFYDFLETLPKEKQPKVGRSTVSKTRKKRKRKAPKQPVEEKKILVKLFTPTPRGTISERNRLDIVIRQGMKCNLCLTSYHRLLHDLTFEVDHIIPLEQGGAHGKENMQALCPACHIYKTRTLDKGVIARLLQASRSSGITPTRTQILEQCQIMYQNRNRLNPPHREDDMIDFAISAREILSEMCKRKVNRMLQMRDIMSGQPEADPNGVEQDVEMKTERVDKKKKAKPSRPPIDEDVEDKDIDSQPPKKKRKGMSSKKPVSPMTPLEHLAFLIEQMEWLGMESSVLRMPNFRLTIRLDLDEKFKVDKTSDEFRKELNKFFRECLAGDEIEAIKTISDITLTYQVRTE
jgi:5-methylcytosine-specific restriction endonuclease McrA